MAAEQKRAMRMGFEVEDFVSLDKTVDEMVKAHDEAIDALERAAPLEFVAMASVITSLMGAQTAILSTRLAELNDTMMAQHDVLTLMAERMGIKLKPNGTVH